jgi:3-oxoacyl-[acyl-carrier-protein] synthase II
MFISSVEKVNEFFS